MNVKLDLSGLQRLRRNASAFSGTHQVKLVDLFDNGFMQHNTRFSSFEAMVSESGIEDFASTSDADKDAMVSKLTGFISWQEFLNAAGIEYTKKQLFK